MKIIVKSEETNLKLYVPNFLLTSGIRLSKFIIKIDNKDTKSIAKYMDYIDTNMLIYAIKELKKYKGLILAEVKSSDGTYVLLKI